MSKSTDQTLHNRLSAFPEHNPAPILLLDTEGRVTYANAATKLILKQLGLDTNNYTALLPDSCQEDLAILKSGVRRHTSRIYKIDDHHFSCVMNHIVDETEDYFQVYLTDITEQQESLNTIERLAYYDPITGLPNRASLIHQTRQFLRLAEQNDTDFAILIFDLNHFKDINYTLGHHYGDLMLKETAKRLRATIKKNYYLARFGEDEFALLMPKTALEAAHQQAKKMAAAIDAPLELAGLHIDAEGSIGIAGYPAHGETVDTLIQRADVAMHMAHVTNKDIVIYDSAHDNYNTRSLTLMTDLRQAITHDDLDLVFQPKHDIKKNSINGLEVLVRWHHPTHGIIPPDEFIPITEQTRTIGQLTDWVLNSALKHCAEFHKKGYQLGIAVNASAQDLLDQHFPNRINDHLLARGIAAGYLTIEITENALVTDSNRSYRNLQRLHDLGIRVAIDDFGTGYSSLAYLKKLPVDELKIDKSFVIDLLENENSQHIVMSIINLAHHMRLWITAEGIESQTSLSYLEGLGCDTAQGYYIARPMAATELLPWLAGRRN